MDFLNAVVALANFVIIPATAYGAQLALGALGVTLIYGILRFSNFAHGDTMAFGTMVTILVTWAMQAAGISLGVLPTALLALPLGLLLAWVLLAVINVEAFGWRLPMFVFPSDWLLLFALALLAGGLAGALPARRLYRVPPSRLLGVFANER